MEAEILRQVDKSINNSIGTFHEQVLGGILGYQRGNHSGFDIKAEDAIEESLEESEALSGHNY